MTPVYEKTSLPALPPALLRALASYGATCASEASQVAQQEVTSLRQLLAEIREAVGDPDRPDADLVQRIRAMAAPAPETEDQARSFAENLLPRPRKLWGMAADVDNCPALYTENDALAYGHRMYQLGRQHGRMDDREALRAAEAQKRHEEEVAWADWRRGVAPKPGGRR